MGRYNGNELTLEYSVNKLAIKLIGIANINQGALKVCEEIKFNTSRSDPAAKTQTALVYLGILVDHGICENRLARFYEFVCQKDVMRVYIALRAVELGYLNSNDLNEAIDGRRRLDFRFLLQGVRAEIRGFAEGYEIPENSPSSPAKSRSPTIGF